MIDDDDLNALLAELRLFIHRTVPKRFIFAGVVLDPKTNSTTVVSECDAEPTARLLRMGADTCDGGHACDGPEAESVRADDDGRTIRFRYYRLELALACIDERDDHVPMWREPFCAVNMCVNVKEPPETTAQFIAAALAQLRLRMVEEPGRVVESAMHAIGAHEAATTDKS